LKDVFQNNKLLLNFIYQGVNIRLMFYMEIKQ
jgi:hypothetical protein